MTTLSNSHSPANSNRIQSIDLLRGIVMVLMALDHVRDFFSNAAFNPVDLSKTNGWMFFTRWITHYCAPTFVFLAGVSAFLYGNKCNSKTDLSIFLLTRGLWIALLEHTAIRFGWFFNFDYTLMVNQVIWAIGISMVILSVLVFLPRLWVGIIGLIIIAGHNLLDNIEPEAFGKLDWLWKILHANGAIALPNGYMLFVGYPIIPWLGIMCAGFGFGTLFLKSEPQRSKLFLWIGSAIILAFVRLRLINGYGDPNAWQIQSSSFFTFLSFLNTTKYPPSLFYVLMTLGPAIVMLSFLEKWKSPVAIFFVTIGSVPMFYYLMHLFLIHSMAIVVGYATGADISFLWNNTPPWATERTFGFGLPIVYLVWIVAVATLYPSCKWYMQFKKDHKDWRFLSYL